MFANSKPFGTACSFGTSSFVSTPSPFGQTNTAFGAKPPTSNVFGTSAFGTSTPSTGGLFGPSTPSTGTGLFGQTPTAFGQPASTSGGSFAFGSTSTTGGLFGTNTQPTQSSGLFGSSGTSAFGTPRPTFGTFGTNTTGTGLFGQSTSTGTGLFGSTTGFSTPTPSGTTVKFNPPTGTDTMMKGGVSTNISTRHQCITCMKEYENKSLEELRMEDYAANRKGPQGGMTGFGATGQTGLFGSNPAASTSAFSFATTQAKPLFGNSGTSTFGTSGTNLFGQTSQSQNTAMFGKTVGFGATTTPAGSTFTFGGTGGTNLFGQNNQQKTLFGQQTGGSGLFGTPGTTQQTTGFGAGTGFSGFGATTQQPTNLFCGKPTAFGVPNTTTTNSFTFGNASNATNGGIFGQKPSVAPFGTNTGFNTSGFGAFNSTPTANTGLFAPAKSSTGFGTTNSTFGSGLNTGFGSSGFSLNVGSTGTGLFGNSNANKSTGFSFNSLGGSANTGFGFGQSGNTNSTFNLGSAAGPGLGSDPNMSLLMQQQQLQTQQQILALVANPFGDSPLFRNSIKETNKREEVLKPTNPSAQKALLSNSQYKVSPLPSTKIKPKPIPLVSNGKASFFDGLEDEDSSFGNMTFVPKKSVKKLTIKPKPSSQTTFTVTSNISTIPNKPTEINFLTSIMLENCNDSSSSTPQSRCLTVDNSKKSPLTSITEPVTLNILPESHDLCKNDALINPLDKNLPENSVSRSFQPNLDDTFEALHTRRSKLQSRALGMSTVSDVQSPDKDVSLNSSSSFLHDGSYGDSVSHLTGIVLKRHGYYTKPNLDEMVSMLDEDGNCFVENFTIGHEKYGSVCFPGITNVAGLNLDEIVHFRSKEITVYPDDDNKPHVGEGLNRKAEVTLDSVWPTDKTTHSPIKDPERLALIGYQEKIERATKRLNASFIEYRPETGSWVFQVLHFSKYGLEDSDDEYEEPMKSTPMNPKSANVNPKPLQAIQVMNGHASVENGVSSQSQLQKKQRISDDDDEMEDITASSYHVEGDKIKDGLKNEFYSPSHNFEDEFYSPSHNFVSSLGVDAERIQGMKASFFQEEMDDNWAMLEGKDNILNISNMKLPESVEHPSKRRLKSFKNMPSFDYKSDTLEYMKNSLDAMSISNSFAGVESGIQPKKTSALVSARTEILSCYPVIPTTRESSEGLPVESSISGASRKLVLKPFSHSLSYKKQKQLADMGYFMGHRFRPGWGPNWTVLHLGKSMSFTGSNELLQNASIFSLLSRPLPMTTREFSPLSVSLGKVQLIPDVTVDEIIKKHLEKSLEVQLNHSAVAVEDGAPIFIPKPGIKSMHAHAEVSLKQLSEIDSMHMDADFMQQCSNVWELCISLWGDIPGLTQEQGTAFYMQQMSRREALSKWLVKTSESKIQTEINNSKDTEQYLAAVFSHLSGRQITQACMVAQEFRNHRLSLLLAQGGANPFVRRLITKQLNNWERSKADNSIAPQRMKLFALLAGILVWHTSKGKINCCENLDWKRCLALHLWYHCYPSASIQDAVVAYESAFQGTSPHGKYAELPYPPYLEKNGISSEMWFASGEIGKDEGILYDTCYHLLKLYCDRSHRLDKLLMPGSSTLAHLDHRLSWLLSQALVSIGYTHLPSEVAAALHCNFASQLEAMGMWHWAAFVLLHTSDAVRRTKCVKDLLLRHLSLNCTHMDQERETFMQDKLQIPKEWIFEAKAIKAHCLGQPADEAWYLLKAGLWNKSHSIIITHLASDAIINENYDYLSNYLKELSPTERSSTILDWGTGGQVFLDYIHISQTVNQVLKGDVSAYDLEKLRPEVVSLCCRLSSLQCVTAKDRLCQAEMSKKTATLLRAVFTLQQARAGNALDIHLLAAHVNKLPMPEDYFLQELRPMAGNYLLAVTSE